MLYPVYQAGCLDIAIITSFTGNFIGNAYDPDFLINELKGKGWPSSEPWSSAESFYRYLEKSNSYDFIIVERVKNTDFLDMINIFKTSDNFKVLIDLEHPMIFKNYILYHYALKK